MLRKVMITIFTVLFVLGSSLPVFASAKTVPDTADIPIKAKNLFDEKGISKDKQVILYEKYKAGELPDVFNPELQKLIPEEFYTSEGDKEFVFPDGSYLKVSVVKTEEIPLIPENKEKLISLSSNEAYINSLYSNSSNRASKKGIVQPLSVIYHHSWIEGISGLVNAKYYQEELLDMSYSQSRITYVDPDSLQINVYGGSYQILVKPKVSNYQQNGTTPARSYTRFSVTINGLITNTFTLEGFVRDTLVWASFTHY